MITQNPIIGKARKKVAGVYARTFYGKNVVQSCPPSRRGKQTPAEMAASRAFSTVALLSNQVSASLLNSIYYAPPSGRSRRSQWMKDLAKGSTKDEGSWTFDPSLIQKLGGNPKVTESALNVVVDATRVEIPLTALSAVGNAVTTEKPCLILIDVVDKICIDLLSYTTLTNGKIVLENLSQTLLGKECWLFPLWQVNVGTQQNPIYAYGRFEKS